MSHWLAGFPGWQFSATMALGGALQTSARAVAGKNPMQRTARRNKTIPDSGTRLGITLSPCAKPRTAPKPFRVWLTGYLEAARCKTCGKCIFVGRVFAVNCPDGQCPRG